MKVSVAVVTYNQEKYIKQCLDGIIMQQTDFEYDVIVGEDSGTDKTLSICEKYAKQYPQIKILPKQERLGIGQNWMRVLKACSGDYIAFCEGDDYWTHPLKLQRQVEYLDAHPEYSMCYTDCDIYYEDKNRFQKCILKKGLAYIDKENPLKAKGYQSNVTWVFKKNIIEYLDFKNYSVDCSSILFFEMYIHGRIGQVLNINSTGVYRRHEHGATAVTISEKQKYENDKEAFLIRVEYVKFFPEKEIVEFLLYLDNMEKIFEKSVKYGDESVMSMFLSYFSNIEGLTKLFLCVKEKNQQLQDLYESRRYKIGNTLLRPFVILKNLIKCR